MRSIYEYRIVWEREHVVNDKPYRNRYYSKHYTSLEAAQRKVLRLQGRIAESKGHDRDETLCGCDWSGYREHSGECETWGEWEDKVTAEWPPLVSLRIEYRHVPEWSVHTVAVDAPWEDAA